MIHISFLLVLGSFSGNFYQNKMAGGIIEVTIPPLLGPYVVDYSYTYENESGIISDSGNRFNLAQNTKIVIMNPFTNCSNELTQIFCSFRGTFISRKFLVGIMTGRLFVTLL